MAHGFALFICYLLSIMSSFISNDKTKCLKNEGLRRKSDRELKLIHNQNIFYSYMDREYKELAWEFICEKPYLFCSKSFPRNAYHRPSVSNGHIGAVIHEKRIYMNGLFNGRREYKSYRAEIPSPLNVNISGTYPAIAFDRYYFVEGKSGSKLLQEDQLLAEHIDAWNKLWNEGRIEVKGNLSLSKMVAAAQFYLLSSIPLHAEEKWPYFGLSPNGLPWGGKNDAYWGHYFWDQSTWMYPSILLLHPSIGKLLINTRARTLGAAEENAMKLNMKGLKYAWESAFTGLETTPLNSSYATQELHINGDVSFAIMQYYWSTHDIDIFLKENFTKVVLGIADFWVDKVKFNPSLDKYDINGIQPPDEYATDVNNSAYTNVIAKLSLEAASFVASLVKNESLAVKYASIARKIRIPFNKALQYHPEYQGYKLGTVIKQADVVLLGYPLMYNMSKSIRRNDLEIYDNVTDEEGPAMTWTMYGIGWLELGEFEKAWSNIAKVYQNVVNEFQVWSEYGNGEGSPNFLTGMGGFLQSIIFGYGGVRLRSDRLEFNPVLPPDTSSVHFNGIDYLNHTFNLSVWLDQVSLTLRAIKNDTFICLFSRGAKGSRLLPGIAYILPRNTFYISKC